MGIVGAIDIFRCPSCDATLIRRTTTINHIVDRQTSGVSLVRVDESEKGETAKVLWLCKGCQQYIAIAI